jgi:hypothetical protein
LQPQSKGDQARTHGGREQGRIGRKSAMRIRGLAAARYMPKRRGRGKDQQRPSEPQRALFELPMSPVTPSLLRRPPR